MTSHNFQLANHQHDVPGEPPQAVVEVSGEIDVTSVAAFAKAISDQAGPGPLVTDLSLLRYIDSAGFAALDTLLSHDTITIVLAPGSPTRVAAQLIGLPFTDSVGDAVRQRRT